MSANSSSIKLEKNELNIFSNFTSKLLLLRYNLQFFILISICCIFLPFFIFFYYGGSYVTFGNESLAYRYFTTYRLMSGESGYLWLPQGYFTLVLQKLILIIQNIFIQPFTSFQHSLESFSLLTNIVQNLLALAFLIITFRDKYITNFQKWIPLIFYFIVIHGIYLSGYYYVLIPDYYQLDIALLASCICFYFCIAARNTNKITLALVATIGFFSGLAIANKISLLFPFMAPISLIFIKHIHQYKRLIFLLFVYTTTTTMGILLPLLFLYGSHNNISEDFIRWVAFVSSPGSESNFFDNLKSIYLDGSNYFRFSFSYLIIWMLGFISIIRESSLNSRNFLSALFLFCLFILSIIIPLKVRSAGTTNFEVFCSITALTLMLVALTPIKSLLYRFKWVFLLIWLPLFHPISELHSLVQASLGSKKNSHIVWAAHNTLLTSKGPALMVLPDNSYGVGSVEELLLKGLSEFPTWDITTGKELLNKFAPNLSIYTATSTAPLKESYSSIMWIDKIEDKFSLKNIYPIKNIIESKSNYYHCKQWMIYNSRMINVCTSNN